MKYLIITLITFLTLSISAKAEDINKLRQQAKEQGCRVSVTVSIFEEAQDITRAKIVETGENIAVEDVEDFFGISTIESDCLELEDIGLFFARLDSNNKITEQCVFKLLDGEHNYYFNNNNIIPNKVKVERCLKQIEISNPNNKKK